MTMRGGMISKRVSQHLLDKFLGVLVVTGAQGYCPSSNGGGGAHS